MMGDVRRLIKEGQSPAFYKQVATELFSYAVNSYRGELLDTAVDMAQAVAVFAIELEDCEEDD